MRIAGALVDLLAPPTCVACGSAAAQVWCRACLGALADLALEGGEPVALGPGIQAASAYRYEGVVRDTVLAVKVRGRHDALEAMGSLLRGRLGVPPPGVTVTWAPPSPSGLRRRGVDVARRLAGPAAVKLLERTREAPEQKRLGGAQRRAAVAGAFAATGRVPRAVVLVDDVRTTGATALAAAAALRRAGARRVLVATFAAAGGHPSPVASAGARGLGEESDRT